MISFLRTSRFQQIAFAIITFILATIAIFNPFSEETGIKDVGGLLIWAALLVFIQGFRRSSVSERNSAHVSAFISFLLGVLLINAELFVSNAVYLFTAILFATDALRQLFAFIRRRRNKLPYMPQILSFLGNFAVLMALFFFRGTALEWVVSFAGSLRIAGMGFEILSARIGVMKEVSEDVLTSIGLQDHPEIAAIANKIEENEASRAPIDRYWIITFLIILFFIHLGRIGFDRSSSGLLSPFVSLVGDIVIAMIIAYAVIIPITGIVRRVLRPFEKKPGYG